MDLENIKFLLEIIVAVAAIVSAIYAFYRFVLKPFQEIQRIKNEKQQLIEEHKSQIKRLEERLETDVFKLRETLLKERNEFTMASHSLHDAIAEKNRTINLLEDKKRILELDLATFSKSAMKKTQEDLIQEEKVVYVKYLYITPSYLPPQYIKYVERINEDVEVYSEHLYYRFNKFNREDNQIVIKDTSKYGVVDLNIIYPWLGKITSTSSSDIQRGVMDKTLRNSNIYLSMTSYYNSFIEGQEDIGMRMEYDTKSAKLIADFSSIPDHDKFFKRNPDGYIKKYEGDENPITYLGLKSIRHGVYVLQHENLKVDSKMELDFHVNWDYLKQRD